jgi:uncharacterized protein
METHHLPAPEALIASDQPPDLARKALALGEWFAERNRVLVAFSGGVDSALVAFAARSVMGSDRVLAVVADSPSLPRRELAHALSFARRHDIPCRTVGTEEGDRGGYIANRGDRCYYCKQELYTVLESTFASGSFDAIINGTNADDPGDWRPGLRAADERNVRSPLLETGFTKQEVRDLSRSLELEIWDKPALPCLASRVPHGQLVTAEKLALIEQAEEVLWNEGFKVFRVRHYGDEARLEIGEGEIGRFEDAAVLGRVQQGIRECGFNSVILETEPYRRGRLNEALEGLAGDGVAGHGPAEQIHIRMPADSGKDDQHERLA